MFKNFNRKAIAVGVAILIWVFTNQTITDEKTVPNVAVKVVNIPSNKTIIGLLANGYLNQRVALTLSGSKDVVEQLDQGDLEVHLDATNAENENWAVQITKKNLISLNPNLDLKAHIKHVRHPELVVTFSNLVTEKVSIRVKPPVGQPPEGYQFLGIWPDKLVQTFSGPQQEMHSLKAKGIKFFLDLSMISKGDLDLLQQSKRYGHDDEISYFVPTKWKRVSIPFQENTSQEINDPEAENLRIDFLRKQLLPIGKDIPITVFYPRKHLTTINPKTHRVKKNAFIREKHNLTFFTLPLYAKDVSRLFLDIIRDHIQIVIIASPSSERDDLQWSLEVIDPKELEDTYLAYAIADQKKRGSKVSDHSTREKVLRNRFKDYMQKFTLSRANGENLNLSCKLNDNSITVNIE